MLRRALLLTTFLALVTGCGGGGGVPAPAPTIAPLEPIGAAARKYRDPDGGIADEMRRVIRDGPTLADIWGRATSRQIEPPPPPVVDFTREMIVVAAAGQREPGDHIRVDSAGVRTFVNEGTGDREEILFVYVSTILGCDPFAGNSYPVDIVAVPRYEGEIRFDESERRDPNCTGAHPAP
jgi:hypothetical protein